MPALTNQMGEPIEEEVLFTSWGRYAHCTNDELHLVVALLVMHAKVTIVRTNATKHGNTEIVLREDTQ